MIEQSEITLETQLRVKDDVNPFVRDTEPSMLYNDIVGIFGDRDAWVRIGDMIKVSGVGLSWYQDVIPRLFKDPSIRIIFGIRYKYTLKPEEQKELTDMKLKSVSALTERQKNVLRNLKIVSPTDALLYLGSLSGVKATKMKSKIQQYDKRDVYGQNYAKQMVSKYAKVIKEFKDPTSFHKPFDTKKGEWLGVEIECFIPVENIKGASLERCGECYQCETDDNDDYNGECESPSGEGDARQQLIDMVRKNDIGGVTVKSDGSIECDLDFVPVEFSCVFLRSNPKNLEKLCKLLNSLGARVNKSCGLHVHLDSRDLFDATKGRISRYQATRRGRRLARCLDVLKTLIPKSRWAAGSFNKLKMSYTDRYVAVNMCSLNSYQTIEVRLHSATTDFNKIIKWSNLLYDISRNKNLNKRNMPELKTVHDLFNAVYADNISDKLEALNYFTARYIKFNPKPEQIAPDVFVPALNVEEDSGVSAA